MSTEALEVPVSSEVIASETQEDAIEMTGDILDQKATSGELESVDQSPTRIPDLSKIQTKKKRLTLQERLALATKTKDKKESLSASELLDPEKFNASDKDRQSKSPSPTPMPMDKEVLEVESSKANTQQIKPELDASEDIKSLVAQNNKLKSEIAKLQSSKLQQELTKKDEIIAQLMKEGEQLSIKELKLNDTIKRLRVTNQSYEEVIADLNEKDAEHSEKLAEIDDILKKNKLDMKLLSEALKEYNKLITDGVKQKLEQVTKDFEKEVKKNELKSKEINELRIQMDLLKETNKIEINNKEEIIQHLKAEVANVKTMNSNEIIRLESKIESLIMETESTTDTTEVNSKDHQKLLRNFNNLQAEMLNSKSNWELIEINLNSKITDLTNKLEYSRKEKHQMVKDIRLLQDKLTDANDTIASLREDVERLELAINEKDEIIEDLNIEKTNLNEKILKINQLYNSEKQLLSKNIDDLSNQLKEKDEKSISNGYLEDMSYNNSRGFESSIYEYRNESAHSLVSDLDTLPFTESNTRDNSREVSSLDNNFNSFQLINKLSNTVKTLKVELSSIKEEVEQVNTEKDILEREILSSSKKTQEVDAFIQKIHDLEQQLQDRDSQEDQLLEIIGEKEEKLEELRNDVQDLKDLCKLQVQQMIQIQEQRK